MGNTVEKLAPMSDEETKNLLKILRSQSARETTPVVQNASPGMCVDGPGRPIYFTVTGEGWEEIAKKFGLDTTALQEAVRSEFGEDLFHIMDRGFHQVDGPCCHGKPFLMPKGVKCEQMKPETKKEEPSGKK